MNQQLDQHITDLKDTIATWDLFLVEVLKLNNEDIKQRGEDNYKMVWTQSTVDYYFDHNTLSSINFYVAKKAGIITDVRFNIPNHIIRKGIDNCEKYIKTEISNLQKSIKSLQQK